MNILQEPRWRWSYLAHDPALLQSIQQVGQASPIWISEKGQILDGFKRYQALKILGIAPQYIIVKEEPGLLQKVFALNVFGQKNILDRGQIFLTLKAEMGELIPANYLNQLGFKDLFAAKKVSRYLSIPLHILKIVLSYGWAEAVYEKLGRFEDEELCFLEKTIFTWSLNQNKIIQILDYLFETTRRDKSGIAALLNEFEALGVSDNKTDALREFLYKKRYPRFSQQQGDFRKKVKDLKVPVGMTVEPKDAFETERVEVKVTLDSLEELRSFVNRQK